MTELSHLAYYVRDLESSLKFYTQAVDLELKGRLFHGRAAMLSGGKTHHELLLIQAGNADGPMRGKRIGLYHAAWKVGESMQDLKKVKDRLIELGIAINGIADHTITQSIYLFDPDGNEIELFVDAPDIDWSNDSSWLEAAVKPLDLR